MANVKDLLVNGSARVIGTIYGNATSANKLNTNAGSTTQPVYFNNGVPVGITGNISNGTTGNAATATKLTTSRNFKIGSTSKSFNGTADLTWTLSEIGAAAANHTHTIANITNLQSTLDAKVPTSRTINGKALSSNITLSASDVGADPVGSADSALESAKSYTDEEIANIQIGGRNLLRQSLLTDYNNIVCDGMSGTNDLSSATLTSEGMHMITPSSGNGNNGIIWTFNDLTSLGLLPGDTITFSAYVKGTSDGNMPFIRIYLQAKGTTWYDSGSLSYIKTFSPDASSFRQVSVTATLPSSDVLVSKRMWIGISGNYSSDLYIQRLKLERGNKATDWTPAPEDVQSAIDGKANANHTHNYAGSSSAGGSANSAVKLDSSAGSATQPIYFSGGKPVAITGTIANNISGNAASASKVNNKLTFGSKTYDGSAAVTLAASDLGLSSAMLFLGTTTTAIADGAKTNPVAISGSNKTVTAGNVVLYGSKEFVWTGSAWEELGNEGSYKIVQAAVGDPSASGTSNTFIATISQDANGKITATKKTVAVANSVPTLSWGATSTIGTVAGTNLQVKMPANPNVDTKVTQNAVNAPDYSYWRPLIWGASNSSTEGFTPSTVTDGVYTAQTLSCQPSSGTIRATTFKGNLSGNADTAINADKLDGYHENSFLRCRDEIRGSGGTSHSDSLWSQIGIKQYNDALPDAMADNATYNYGAVVSLPGNNSRLDIWYNHLTTEYGEGLRYRTGWNDDKRAWATILDSLNYGTIADSRYVKKTGDTMTGKLQVNAPIFGYNYTNSSNAAAFTFDKPGSYITGIGSNGSRDTIYFCACDNNGSWITSYKQKWVFNGSVTADTFYGELSGNAATATNVAWSGITDKPPYYDIPRYTGHIGFYASSDTHILKLGYWNCTYSYDNLTLLVSSSFWGNQHGSTDIITLRQDLNDNASGSVKCSCNRVTLMNSNRTFYYNIDQTNRRVYLYVYVTGGNSYGKWNTSVLQSDGGSWVSEFAANQPKQSSFVTIDYVAVYGAVWNDYAEYRSSNITEPGLVIVENGNGTLSLSTERLQRGAEVISDTYGFAIGETDECKTPIAATGRVLAYTYESIEEYRSKTGWPVCSGPNGTVSIMTEEEEEKYPSRIIGTISEVPDYKEWGTGKVKTNGRVWIRIK